MASRALGLLSALLLWLAASTTPAFAEDLDKVLASAMEGTKAPAMAMVVLRDGKVAGEAVRGVRRNDGTDPARIDDVWLIGSDAKPMTATLIARLVDRGVLSWDAPLSQMLPDLAATMRPEYRSVTLVQLLSHRSGLAHDTSDMAYFATFYADKRALRAQRLAYIDHALREPPAVPPGTSFSYSNTGFLIAAAIAEQKTGVSYEDLMRREVFGPLSMASVGYGTTHAGQPIGHQQGKPITKPEDSNPLMFAPAGNLHLSMRDWARFCIDQLAGAKGQGKLLSAASYRMMQTRLPGATSGLAWGVQDSIAGRRGPVLTHAGSDGNWNALVALFPATGNGVLVVTNSDEDMGGDKATKAVVKALLPELAPEA
jgi:CubicO group peptidase (beta-lactamase class C family)